MASDWEITKHYNGEATVTFKPGAHGYWVDDPKYVNPKTGKIEPKKNARTGGGTSITGTLAKGQGLMLWPMYEMNKSLKIFFETTTVRELIDKEELTVETILKAGRDAHTQKSDRGKSVGTDAHSWIEQWCKAKMASQESGEAFVCPEIPAVEDIAVVLRASYLRIINALKPKTLDDWKRLPKLLFKEIEIQEAIWTEASMTRQSIVSAKQWLDMHDIHVYGAEDTVYSRKLFVGGKYDGDWQVTCSKKCTWCFTNMTEENAKNYVKDRGWGDDFKFSGRYVVDFKSTNASQDQPKGIYPEYLAQCAVYEIALLEEAEYEGRELKYDGYLILNGAKTPYVDYKTKIEYPQFNTHFTYNHADHRRWATILAENKELIYKSNQEMKASNAGIRIPTQATA